MMVVRMQQPAGRHGNLGNALESSVAVACFDCEVSEEGLTGDCRCGDTSILALQTSCLMEIGHPYLYISLCDIMRPNDI